MSQVAIFSVNRTVPLTISLSEFTTGIPLGIIVRFKVLNLKLRTPRKARLACGDRRDWE